MPPLTPEELANASQAAIDFSKHLEELRTGTGGNQSHNPLFNLGTIAKAAEQACTLQKELAIERERVKNAQADNNVMVWQTSAYAIAEGLQLFGPDESVKGVDVKRLLFHVTRLLCTHPDLDFMHTHTTTSEDVWGTRWLCMEALMKIAKGMSVSRLEQEVDCREGEADSDHVCVEVAVREDKIVVRYKERQG